MNATAAASVPTIKSLIAQAVRAGIAANAGFGESLIAEGYDRDAIRLAAYEVATEHKEANSRERRLATSLLIEVEPNVEAPVIVDNGPAVLPDPTSPPVITNTGGGGVVDGGIFTSDPLVLPGGGRVVDGGGVFDGSGGNHGTPINLEHLPLLSNRRAGQYGVFFDERDGTVVAIDPPAPSDPGFIGAPSVRPSYEPRDLGTIYVPVRSRPSADRPNLLPWVIAAGIAYALTR